MNKVLLAGAFSALTLLGACSSGSSSNDSSSPVSPGQISDDQLNNSIGGTIQKGQCKTADAATEAAIQNATDDVISTFQAIADGDFKQAQKVSPATKATFKSVINQHPDHCGAQLGYAVSIVSDLVNNASVKELIDRLSEDDDDEYDEYDEYSKVMNLQPSEMPTLLYKTSALAKDANQKVLTDQIQQAAASAIASIDTAIVYMRNVSSVESFSFDFNYDDRRISLDKGEFAPALGALHLAKAFLIAVASVNIKLDENGSYDWIELADVGLGAGETMSAEQIKANQKMIDLYSASSPFTTVYSEWQPYWKTIPSLLDSAVRNVEEGLKYSIAEASIPGSQDYDLYIVGDGEEADVSTKDMQKALDTLEHFRKAILNTAEINIRGVKFKVNLSNFFGITDGFQDYIPYIKFRDVATWSDILVENMTWTDDIEESFVWTSMAQQIAKQVEEIPNNVAGIYAYGYHASWNNDDPGVYRMGVDYDYPDYDYYSFYVKIDGCNFASGDERYIFSGTMDSRYCKATAEGTLYAAVEDDFTYDMDPFAFFANKSGNITISVLDLQEIDDEQGELAWREAVKKNVILPDPTFNGTLPGQTQESVWQLFFDLADVL
ncbi:MAG: hypothetical protein HUK21_07155 [Fibrobacteraceae bacterium]|nr:hypothetical protein [Fibrobacteraceae bacterium]